MIFSKTVYNNLVINSYPFDRTIITIDGVKILIESTFESNVLKTFQI
jgi:hypothetical protein